MTDRPVRLLDLGEVSPLRSQAIYHGLGASMDDASPDTIVLCRPAAPYFCVGYHQSPAEELDLDWCREAGYPVLQRRIGGGTVFLDSSQLFYQCIFHRRRAPLMVDAIYRRFLMPVVEALRALGLAATLEGVNEIEVEGRRIAGTGGGQIGEAVVVVGNVLLDFPEALMARA
ncbi:MAG: lipoate--protein ligase family protein, partial [candidate division NC10 bacterium]